MLLPDVVFRQATIALTFARASLMTDFEALSTFFTCLAW